MTLRKGEVSTGRDARTVQFMFVCVCIVAWRDSPIPEYSTRLTLGATGDLLRAAMKIDRRDVILCMCCIVEHGEKSTDSLQIR
jgi:hypothetical protein